VLLSSHLLHQVQAVCDRVGLFYRGRLALEGAVGDLAQQVLGGAYRIHIEVEGPAELENQLSQIPAVVSVRRHGDSGYDLEATSDVRPEIARAVVEAGRRLLAIQNETPSLDEIYARYFKEVEHVSAA
jgi:ABC-2 type transport system ATP-binding protein